MNKRILASASWIAFVIALIINFLAITPNFNDNTVASVSARYANLLTPAGFVFSIWWVIYLGLLGYCIYQSAVFSPSSQHPGKSQIQATETVYEIGWLFTASSLANTAWILLWLYEYLGLSVLMLSILLYLLLRIITQIKAKHQRAGINRKLWVWWPFSIYAGWVTFAWAAGLSAWLTSLGWTGFILSQQWAIALISLLAALYVIVLWLWNMRSFVLPGIWGFCGLALTAQAGAERLQHWAGTLVVILVAGVVLHGYTARRKRLREN